MASDNAEPTQRVWCGSLVSSMMNLAYDISGCSIGKNSIEDSAVESNLSAFGDEIPYNPPCSLEDATSWCSELEEAGGTNEGDANSTLSIGKRYFHRDRVGATSLAGLRSMSRGLVPKQNQDCGVVCYPFGGDDRQAFFGMFDGHGEHGHHVSDFCKRQVQHFVQQHPLLQSKPGDALIASFERVDQILHDGHINAAQSGTTAVGVLMRRTSLWVANAGDSRAVIGRATGEYGLLQAVPLTEDHKPDEASELERIEAMGGFVSQASVAHGPARVRVKAGRGGLTLSRAIGDIMLGEVGVIPTPDVRTHQIEHADRCLVLATDGVWEFISWQRAIDVVSQHRNATDASAALVAEAAEQWAVNENGGRDDITALVIFLPCLPSELPAETLSHSLEAPGDDASAFDSAPGSPIPEFATPSMVAEHPDDCLVPPPPLQI